MERLTIEYDGHYVPKELCTIDRLGGADDCAPCGDSCSEDCNKCAIQKCFDKLAEYEDLEEQGLLLKLPCKVGDTVYEIIRGMIVPSMVTGFRIGKMMGEDEEEYEEDYKENTWYIQAENGMSSQSFPLSAVGKTYWFTREEAQAALEKMKGE